MTFVRLVVAAACTALAAAPAAIASDATPAGVAALAGGAGTDPRALAALRQVDRVGGRRVDLATALDVRGSELDARLRVLAAGPGTAGPPKVDPRKAAGAILAERRFSGSSVPRPLHGPLEWLGRQLHSFYDWVVRWLPGGENLFWALVAGAVAALAAVGAAGLARRRGGRLLETRPRAARDVAESPRQLEREADEAERAGEFERALRLRFRAGLMRLTQAEAIPRRRSLTNGEIARRLDSARFAALAADFDEVVYGRRAAAGADAAHAREAWPLVVEEAGRQ